MSENKNFLRFQSANSQVPTKIDFALEMLKKINEAETNLKSKRSQSSQIKNIKK